MAAEDYMMPCLTKKFLGVDCFGCGTQRAFMMLLEGDFAGAFKMYPAIYSLLLLLGVFLLNFIDKKRNYGQLMILLGIVNAVIILVSYFYKHPLALH